MAAAGFIPDEWQRRLADGKHKRRQAVATRQGGKTQVTAFAAVVPCLNKPGVTVVVCAPRERQAVAMVRRSRAALRQVARAPGWDHPVTVVNKDVTRIEFSNGSELIAMSGDPTSTRGPTAHRLVIEEAAFVSAELFGTITGMLATTGGDIIAISSAFAEAGWFYDAWRAGDHTWHRECVPARVGEAAEYGVTSTAGHDLYRISDEFLAAERATMPAATYAREYLCVFSAPTMSTFRPDDIDRVFDADNEINRW
jgi:hypothetical protein